MNPRRAKELLPPICEELDLPLELGEDLSEFYWSTNHKIFTSLEHYHVKIPHLGAFHIRGPKQLNKTIEKYDKYVPKYKFHVKSEKKFAIIAESRKKLDKLRTLLAYYYKERELEAANRELRKHVRHQKDLELKETDTGRTNQLDIHQTGG